MVLKCLTVMLVLFCAGCVQQEKAPIIGQSETIKKETIINGDKQSFFDGKIESWEIIATDGNVRLAGIKVPLQVATNAFYSKSTSTTATLNMPTKTKESTFLDHIDIQFSQLGFNSDLKVASFAFRYFGINQNNQRLINCLEQKLPTNDYIPEGFVPIEAGKCDLGIGTRFTSKDTYYQDIDHPSPFARLNFGYYNGKMVFIEPIISVDKLLKRESFTLYIPLPKTLGEQILLPSTFTAVYDLDSDSYDFSMWGFANAEDSE